MTNLFANHSSMIAPGSVVSGVADREQTLRIICGHVWITIEGSARDYWLSAGDSLQIAPGRLVVIEATRMNSRVDVPYPTNRQGRFHFHGAGMRALAQRLIRLTHGGFAREQLR